MSTSSISLITPLGPSLGLLGDNAGVLSLQTAGDSIVTEPVTKSVSKTSSATATIQTKSTVPNSQENLDTIDESDPYLQFEAELYGVLDEIAVYHRQISESTRLMAEKMTKFRELYLSEMGAGVGSQEGYRALLSELSFKLKIGERQAERFIMFSETITNEMSDIAKALEGDFITAEQAKVIADASHGVPNEDKDEYVRVMLTKACGSPWEIGKGPTESTVDYAGNRKGASTTTLRREARKWKENLQPEKLENQHKEAYKHRAVEVEPAEDGMAWLKFYMSATDAIGIFNGLTTAAKQTLPVIKQNPLAFGYTGTTYTAEDEFNGPYEDLDLPTLTQLRLDIAQDLLLSGEFGSKDALAKALECYQESRAFRERFAGIRIEPTVHITVPVLSILGLDEAPASLEGYGPISAEQATMLCAAAPSFVRILTHPETGSVLSVGRESYRLTKSLKNELIIRDQRCRWPGCGTPATKSEVDHTVAWRDGGETAKTNLAHLCKHHHILKHSMENNRVVEGKPSGRWKVHQDDNGRFVVESPMGQIAYTEPARMPASLMRTDGTSPPWEQSAKATSGSEAPAPF